VDIMKPLGPSSTPQELSVALSSLAKLLLQSQGRLELSEDEFNLHLHVVQSAVAGATAAALRFPRRIK